MACSDEEAASRTVCSTWIRYSLSHNHPPTHPPGGRAAVDGGGTPSVHLSVVVQLPEVAPLVVHGVVPPARVGFIR